MGFRGLRVQFQGFEIPRQGFRGTTIVLQRLASQDQFLDRRVGICGRRSGEWCPTR